MKSTFVLVGAAIGALFAGGAQANPYIAYAQPPEEPAPPADHRTEIHVGMLAGGSDIGDVGGSGVGVALALARRFGELTVLGQFDYLAVGEGMEERSDPRRGSLLRGGMAARYALMRLGSERGPIGTDVWIEAGAGRQRVAWQRGGTLSRNDLSLALGTQFGGRVGEGGRAPSYFGPYFAVRALLSGAPTSEAMEPPTCGGPCDAPSSPSATDLSILFHFGLTWGR